MSVPTRGEEFTKLLEYLIKAQESCAMLAHLHNTEGNDVDKTLAKGWLGIAELMHKMQHTITALATGKLQ